MSLYGLHTLFHSVISLLGVYFFSMFLDSNKAVAPAKARNRLSLSSTGSSFLIIELIIVESFPHRRGYSESLRIEPVFAT